MSLQNMKIWYDVRIMDEFPGEDITDDTECYEIVKLTDKGTSYIPDIRTEYLGKEYRHLTAEQAHEKQEELESKLADKN